MKCKWIIGISPGSKRILYLNPTPLSPLLWNYWSVIWTVESFAPSEVPKVPAASTTLPAPAAQVLWAVHGAWWAVCSLWSLLGSSPCARMAQELRVPLGNNSAWGTLRWVMECSSQNRLAWIQTSEKVKSCSEGSLLLFVHPCASKDDNRNWAHLDREQIGCKLVYNQTLSSIFFSLLSIWSNPLE